MYAEGTTVAVEKSKMEIEKVLRKYGAKNVVVTIDDDHHRIVVAFALFERQVSMKRALPLPTDRAMQYDRSGYARNAAALKKVLDAETRRRFRVVLLQVKSRIEDVFSEENRTAQDRQEAFFENFGLHILLPSRLTVGQVVAPQVEQAYRSGHDGVRLLEG